MRQENITLEDAKLVNGQGLLIEVRLEDGSWPRDRKKQKSGLKEKLREGAPLNINSSECCLIASYEKAEGEDLSCYTPR